MVFLDEKHFRYTTCVAKGVRGGARSNYQKQLRKVYVQKLFDSYQGAPVSWLSETELVCLASEQFRSRFLEGRRPSSLPLGAVGCSDRALSLPRPTDG